MRKKKEAKIKIFTWCNKTFRSLVEGFNGESPHSSYCGVIGPSDNGRGHG